MIRADYFCLIGRDAYVHFMTDVRLMSEVYNPKKHRLSRDDYFRMNRDICREWGQKEIFSEDNIARWAGL